MCPPARVCRATKRPSPAHANPCRAIVRQIIDHHLVVWDDRKRLEERRQGISSHLIRDLVSDLERFGPLLKHASFAAEREWRLISPLVGEGLIPKFIHLPSPVGIKQFQSFSLLTLEHPSIEDEDGDQGIGALVDDRQGFLPVIGPSVDPDGMEEAIRTLMPPEFGWVFQVKRTACPYR